MRPYAGNRRLLRVNTSTLLAIILFAAGSFVLALPFGFFQSQASGTISGTVFQDYNGNGAFDSTSTINNEGTGTVGVAVDNGVANVQVRAFDAAGTNVTTGGFVSTAANGSYSLVATGTGPYRLEFTNLPSGFFPSARSTDSVQGGSATNAGTTVQFVNDGNTSNVNLALELPAEYCQNNPNLVTTRMVGGSQNGTYADESVLMSFPYSAGNTYTGTTVSDYDDPTAHTVNLTADQIGNTLGLAYARNSNRIYAASFFKKHAGFGPGANGTFNEGGASSDDPAAIYVINPATNAVASVITVPGAGTNSHNTANYGTDNGDTAINAVGKTSLGGIALSDDEAVLYAMNLQNRTLYALNSTTGATINSVAVPTAGVPTPGGSADNCAAADVRPFAVRYYRGQIYVGMVCSAESTGNLANLRAYVYQVNPSTMVFGALPAFQVALNYDRGVANPGAAAEWQAWRSTSTNTMSAPQAMLSDIDFDKGNLLLAFKDRAGDQFLDNATSAKRTAGDVLRACGTIGSWTIENNGRCGGTGNGPQGNTQGIGGGEFYYEDEYSTGGNTGNFHDEITWGTMAQLPGYPHAVVSGLDPIDRDISDQTFDGGFRWFNHTTGATNKAYRIYNGTGAASVPDFGKVNGLGDIVALCNPAPIEIGNRVWLDNNANGVQDGNELTGIANVTVRLYNSANTAVGTAVTDANGEYYFVSSTTADGNTGDNVGQVNGGILRNSNYQVRFDVPVNYAGGGALNGRFLTAVNSAFQNGVQDSNDSDASLVTNPTNSPAGTFPVISLTTGGAGANDHTFDVGFSATAPTYSLGNRVWLDTDNDGRIDAGEVGLDNVSVSLFADSNSDGTPDTPGTPVGTQSTAGGGYYRFDSLAAGNYVVRINPANFGNAAVLAGYQNTTGNVTTDTDSTAATSGENGVNPSGAANLVQTNGILSNSVTLGVGVTEPVSESDLSASGQGAGDGFADMTVDFGFYRMCMGNIVFNDMGVGGNRDNGVFDNGEIPKSGAQVRLFTAAGVEIPVGPDGILGTSDDNNSGVVTTGSGTYQFCGMPAGTYRGTVFSNGTTSSTPTDTTPDNNEDSDDNGAPTGSAIGSITTGTIVSNPITLTPGSPGALNANTVTNSTGSTNNPTLDFGLITPPTAVTMSDFGAEDTGNGVGLSWKTGYEVNNLGYRVWRDLGKGRELVSNELIAGSALQVGSVALTAGQEYRVLDSSIKGVDAQNASYWLEAIDLDGTSQWFGPMMIHGSKRSGKFTEHAPTFADLNAANVSVVQQDYADLEGMEEARPELGDTDTAENQAIMNQITSSGGALKIKVNRNGWYRFDAGQLASYGFSAAQSAGWRLYSDGVEQALYVGEDGSLQFYGRGLDATFSDTRVYYMTNGQPGGLRVVTSQLNFDANASEKAVRLVAERKDRSLRSSSVLNGTRENWFAAGVIPTESFSNLALNNVATGGGNAQVIVHLQGLTEGWHYVAVTLNGVQIGQINLAAKLRSEWSVNVPASQLREGNNQIGLRSLNGSNDVSLLETVKINYPRRTQAVSDRIDFRLDSSQSAKLSGFSNEDVHILDITDPTRPIIYDAAASADAGGTYSVTVPSSLAGRNLVAQSTVAILPEAVSVANNSPSTLRATTNGADFIVVAPAQFHQQLAALKTKRDSEGIKTMIVDVENIYDEFGYGTHNPQFIKDFLLYAKANWSGRPRYVMFVGDASADPRNYSGLGGVAKDLIPTMWFDTDLMEASSDEMMVDANGDGLGELMLGRLPVKNEQELANVLAKILSHFTMKPNGANNRGALMVSDSNIGYDFVGGNQKMRTSLPATMPVTVINRDSGTSAVVKQQIINKMNTNPLIVHYFGHGSTGVWTDGNILSTMDTMNLTNDRPSLVVLLTCLNGAFAEQNETMVEGLLKAQNGGAFAVWGATSMNYAHIQEEMGKAWHTMSLSGRTLGETQLEAKRVYNDLATRYTLQLFGDPTQKLVEKKY